MSSKQLEPIAEELARAFGVEAPPIPLETMLQKPRDKMWKEVDITQLSGSFLSISDRYAPRMSLARMLARHVTSSQWGRERGLPDLIADQDQIHTFARMLVMPRAMIESLNKASRNPTTMSMQFEVPEEDARLRLQELNAEAEDEH